MLLQDEMFVNGNRAIMKSYAKINLTLDVLGKRDNGYHDVAMIMQTVGVFDLLIIDKTAFDITVTTNLKYVPSNEKNIAYKAAVEFFKYTRLHGGVKIRIKKNIPVAAGLAGGSGNAAAVLCAMNVLYNANLSYEELCGIGAKLGADVPYCLDGGTCLAEGIGEKLTRLAPMPKMTVLLVKPPVNISTAAIYEEIDNADIINHPDMKKVTEAIKNKDISGIADNLCNVMEAVTERENPVITDIKARMKNGGALGASMSGSGPTVFGLFDDYNKAKLLADKFAGEYKEVFVAEIKNS